MSSKRCHLTAQTSGRGNKVSVTSPGEKVFLSTRRGQSRKKKKKEKWSRRRGTIEQGPVETPSTGLRHPSFNHCRIKLLHRVQKTVSQRAVFRWCSNSSKFVTNNSNKTRRVIYSRQQSFTPAQINPQSFESRRNYSFFLLLLFFYRGGWVSCLRACFGSRLLLQS